MVTDRHEQVCISDQRTEPERFAAFGVRHSEPFAKRIGHDEVFLTFYNQTGAAPRLHENFEWQGDAAQRARVRLDECKTDSAVPAFAAVDSRKDCARF